MLCLFVCWFVFFFVRKIAIKIDTKKQKYKNIKTQKYKKNRGYTIPEGFMILGSFIPGSWGNEYHASSETFDPDRFLNKESKTNQNKMAHIPFSYGERYCLGVHYAMTELKLLAFYIAKHWKININEDITPKLISFPTNTYSYPFKIENRNINVNNNDTQTLKK